MARTLQVASRATRKPRTTKAIPTLEQIQLRAYEIYVQRCGAPGNQMDDWLQAEREILGETPKDSAENRATVIGSAARPGIVL